MSINRSDILLRILDAAKGTCVLPWHRFFRNTFTWDREEVLAYQSERLQKLIRHARETVPYYREEFDRLGLEPGDIKTPACLAELPILDRDAIRNHQKCLLSYRFEGKSLHKGRSSGTTGIPIHYYHDTEGLSAGVAAGYALWGMSGWKPGQRRIHIWGNELSIRRWKTAGSKMKNLLLRQKNIASTLLNDPENMPRLARQAVRFAPLSIEGYASSIYSLAAYFQKQGLRLKNLKMVLTTAENLEPYQQELIEKVFAPTGDLYGSGEVLGIATRPAGEKLYYVLDPHVILETAETGIPGMKNLLITDLNNYGMPMIRYQIGDMVDQLREPVPGAKYPFTWFTKIQGRSSDIISLPNGKKFHPVSIFGGTSFREIPQITRHKVIWDGTTLKFIFEVQERPDKQAVSIKLGALLQPFEVPFSVEYTDRILPSANGKHTYLEIKTRGRKEA